MIKKFVFEKHLLQAQNNKMFKCKDLHEYHFKSFNTNL